MYYGQYEHFLSCSVCVFAQVGSLKTRGQQLRRSETRLTDKSLFCLLLLVTNTIKPVNSALDSVTTTKPLPGSSVPTSPSGFWIDTPKCRLAASQEQVQQHRLRLRGKDRAIFLVKMRSRANLHLVSYSFFAYVKPFFFDFASARSRLTLRLGLPFMCVHLYYFGFVSPSIVVSSYIHSSCTDMSCVSLFILYIWVLLSLSSCMFACSNC